MKLKELIPEAKAMLARLAENGGTVSIVRGLNSTGAIYLNSTCNVEPLYGPEEFEYAVQAGLLTEQQTGASTYKYSITPTGRAFAEELTDEQSLLNGAKSNNRHTMNVHIENFEGLLNTGNISDVGHINVSINKLRADGQERAAQAIKELTEAIQKDEALLPEQKAEAVERIDHLAMAVAQDKSSRAPRFQLTDNLKGLAEIIKTSASALTVWHYAGPLLAAALSINF